MNLKNNILPTVSFAHWIFRHNNTAIAGFNHLISNPICNFVRLFIGVGSYFPILFDDKVSIVSAERNHPLIMEYYLSDLLINFNKVLNICFDDKCIIYFEEINQYQYITFGECKELWRSIHLKDINTLLSCSY